MVDWLKAPTNKNTILHWLTGLKARTNKNTILHWLSGSKYQLTKMQQLLAGTREPNLRAGGGRRILLVVITGTRADRVREMNLGRTRYFKSSTTVRMHSGGNF